MRVILSLNIRVETMDFGPQRGFLLFTLFSLYCPTRHTGLKIFARIFQIKQVKAAKKSLAGRCLQVWKTNKRKTWQLENAFTGRNIHNIWHHVLPLLEIRRFENRWAIILHGSGYIAYRLWKMVWRQRRLYQVYKSPAVSTLYRLAFCADVKSYPVYSIKWTSTAQKSPLIRRVT